MNLIYGEQLKGVIDGVNRVFTSQNTIDSVVGLYLGGITITPLQYTKSGRLITFNVAPIVGAELPILDYYFKDNISDVVVGSVTVDSVLSEVLDVLGITAFNLTTYKKSTAIKKINEFYFGEINTELEIVNNYSFTKGEGLKVGKYYRSDIISTQTIIDNFTPRVGYIKINGSTQQFTTRAEQGFTLPDGYTANANEADYISVGYKIPQAVSGINKILVNGIEYKELTPNQWGSGLIDGTYCIENDYIYFSHNIRGASEVNVFYRKKNVVLEEGDVIDIPFEYSSVLSLYTALKMMNAREDERWQIIKIDYTEMYRKWKAFKNRQNKGKTSFSFNGALNKIQGQQRSDLRTTRLIN